MISFALHLWLVRPKPGRVPCIWAKRLFQYVLKDSEALGRGRIGCVGRFVLVQLLVAPFHYAIDRFICSRGEGRGALGREISQGEH